MSRFRMEWGRLAIFSHHPWPQSWRIKYDGRHVSFQFEGAYRYLRVGRFEFERGAA